MSVTSLIRLTAVHAALAILVTLTGHPAVAVAASKMLSPAGPMAGYHSSDIVPEYGEVKGLDADGNRLFIYDDITGLNLVDRTTGTLQQAIGRPTNWMGSLAAQGAEPFLSFVQYDDTRDSVWVGYTTTTDNEDWIFQVSLASPNWENQVATLSFNWAMDFRDGDAYASGLGGTSLWDPNCIWKLDTSGTGSHQKVVEVGGSSSGMVFDTDGNLYVSYAFYDSANAYQSSGAIYRFAAADIDASVTSGEPLARGDGEWLFDVVPGPGDLALDSRGNLYGISAAFNDSNRLWMWDGDDFTVIAEPIDNALSEEQMGNYDALFAQLSVVGDMNDEGTLYVTRAQPFRGDDVPDLYGVATLSRVPEPGSALLLLVGLGALLAGSHRCHRWA